jgi:hypothetical protein
LGPWRVTATPASNLVEISYAHRDGIE